MDESQRANGNAAAVDLLGRARRAADDGRYDEVLTCYRHAAAAGIDPAATPAWSRLLREGGFLAEARGLAPPDPADSADPPAAPGVAIAADPPPEDDTDLLDFIPGEREPVADAALPATVVRTFLRWFRGRGDVYARQWYDARRDRTGYVPVYDPLDEAVVERHLHGSLTVGQYVLHPDNSVSFAALDLDPTAEALAAARYRARDPEGRVDPVAFEFARRIVAVTNAAGLPSLVEDTGGVGLHVWLFFAPRIPAETARDVLREVLRRVGTQPPSLNVELFPKQDRLSGKGFGNLIKLPFGVHQATFRRSWCLDEDGRPVRDLAAALATIRACEPVAIETLRTRRVADLGAARSRRAADPPLRAPTGGNPRALAEALANIPAGKPTDVAVDRVLAGCPILRDLARRAHEAPTLRPDEARALLYSVGLVGRENRVIEALLASAGVSRKELDRVRRGLQSPIGCARLRRDFAPVGNACACPPAPPGLYATPVLHAFAAPPAPPPPPPSWDDAAAFVKDADEGNAVALEDRIARIETLLESLVRRERGEGADPDGSEER